MELYPILRLEVEPALGNVFADVYEVDGKFVVLFSNLVVGEYELHLFNSRDELIDYLIDFIETHGLEKWVDNVGLMKEVTLKLCEKYGIKPRYTIVIKLVGRKREREKALQYLYVLGLEGLKVYADEIYVPEKYVNEVVEVLKKFNVRYRVVRREIDVTESINEVLTKLDEDEYDRRTG